MDAESQVSDPVHAIEQALVALRLQGRGPRHGHPGAGDHRPPWGDGPPPWLQRPVSAPDALGRGGGRPHDRSLGGAARFRLLAVLFAAESTTTRMGISEVAEAVGVDQPRASRLVNEAAERGMVARAVDERDARRSVITLTPAGRAVLESAQANRRSAVTQALAGFTADETATLAGLLTRFVGGLPR
jgi:DNA-binding MarR family transcriptional regulator